MLKNISYLFVIIALAFVGCTKDDPGKDDKKDDKKEDVLGDEIGQIITAEITEIDIDNKVTDYSITSKYKINELEHQGDRLYYFETEDTDEKLRIAVILRQRDHSTALLQEKTYDFNDPDYMLYVDVNTPDAPDVYVVGDYLRKEYEETRIYRGESIVPTGKVKITKLTSERIEAEFEFEAYTWAEDPYISKVVVKNGKFKGLRG